MAVPVKRTVGAMSLINLVGFAAGAAQAVVVARSFGTGSIYDIYLLAIVVPELITMFTYNLLAALLLPAFHRWQAEKGEAEAWRLFWNTFNLVFLVYIAIGVTVFLAAYPIARLLLGDASPEDISYAVGALRILSPLIVISLCLRIVLSINNAYEIFVFPALVNISPAFFVIASVLFFADKIGPYAIAIGIVTAAIVQVVLMSKVVVRRGLRYYRPTIDMKRPETRAFLWSVITMSVGAVAEHLNVLIDRRIALTLGEGMISSLKYGFQIAFFAQAIFAVPLVNVSFTYLSRDAVADNRRELSARLGRVMSQLVVFYIPASVGLFLLSRLVLSLLFQGGQFDEQSLNLSTSALQAYAFGLAFYAMMNILRWAMYSLRRYWVFSIIAFGSILLTIIFNLLLANFFGHTGIAIARAIVSFAVGAAVLIYLRKAYKIKPGSKWLLSAGKAIIGSAVMAVPVILLLAASTFDMLADRWATLLTIISAAAIGGVVYTLIMILLREAEILNVIKPIISKLFRNKIASKNNEQ